MLLFFLVKHLCFGEAIPVSDEKENRLLNTVLVLKIAVYFAN